MKKKLLRLISTAAALAALCTGSAVSLSAQAADSDIRIMGDLDRDNCVTLNDISAAIDLYSTTLLGLTDETTDNDNYPADIDMDGKITLNDLLLMSEYYALELVGVEPLWADLREVSYVDGKDYECCNANGEVVRSGRDTFTLTGMYLEIGCAAGKPGETVTVPVYVAGANALAGFQYSQSIPAGYTITDITTDLPGRDFAANRGENTGRAAVVWISEDGLNLDIQDGTILAYITYQIPADAQPGDTQIILSDPDYNMFTCENGECYQYTIVNGVIRVDE